MADEDHSAAGAGDVAHLAEAFFLKIDIADGKDFIHKENFRLQVRGDGER